MIKYSSFRQTFLWLFILSLCSCSNDIDLYTPDHDQSFVIYGYINCTDGQHEVKIRMSSGYAGSESSDYKDSTEFFPPDGLIVTMEEREGTEIQTYTLLPVLLPKDPGPFYLGGNVIHETSFATDMDRDYSLRIVVPETGDTISGETLAIPDPKLVTPSWPFIRYDFSSEVDPFTMRIKSVPRIFIYVFSIRFHYLDVMENGDSLLQMAQHDFPAEYVEKPPVYDPRRASYGHDVGISISQTYTLNLMRDHIPDVEGLDHRQIKYFEVTVWGGGENVKDFYLLNERFSDNRKFQFGNIENGIGFFGAVSHSNCIGIYPDQVFMDSLLQSPKYSGLHFIDGFYERQ